MNKSSLPAPVLPTCFAINRLLVWGEAPDKFLYLRSGHEVGEGYAKFGTVREREALTSSMHTRFHLVPSKEQHGDEQLVHIKSSYNNKYLVAREVDQRYEESYKMLARDIEQRYEELQASEDVQRYKEGRVTYFEERYKAIRGGLLVDTTDEPDEEVAKPSCTLFNIQVVSHSDFCQTVRFIHPSTGKTCCFLSSYVDPQTGKDRESMSVSMEVALYDVTDQIILPPYVSFKGENGLYVRVLPGEHTPYLKFDSSDNEDISTTFSTLNFADGLVYIKSEFNGKFLYYTDQIDAYSKEESLSDYYNSFRVLKVGNLFVLQAYNGKFCEISRRGVQGRDVYFYATAERIVSFTKLTLEEPLLSREIYNIEYHRTDHARVHDATVMNLATATAINETSEQNTVKSSMSIMTTASEKHDSTTTHKTMVSGCFTAGINYKVINASVQLQYGVEDSDAKTWGTELKTEKKQEIVYEVTVPANKEVTVTVTAKQAKCNIPFSYTQRDTLLTGEVRINDYEDGLYTGINCFDLSYETTEEDIKPNKKEVLETSSKKRKGITQEDTSMGGEQQA